MHNRIEVKEGRGRREPEGRPADDAHLMYLWLPGIKVDTQAA